MKFNIGRANWGRHQQRWFGKWHVYLGIIAGSIVSIVGITGSILVFRDEIDQALNPTVFTVTEEQGRQRLSLVEIATLTIKEHPELEFLYFSDRGDQVNSTYFTFDSKGKKSYVINPYSGELTAKDNLSSPFTSFVLKLHYTLLIPVVGRYLVGISALILLLLTISGLRLWLPARWQYLKKSLSVKFDGSFKRQNYDWHNVIGFYSAPVVALLSLTGFCMTFTVLVIPILFIMGGQTPQKISGLTQLKSTFVQEGEALSPDAVVSIGKKVLPESKVEFLFLPRDSVGTYSLTMRSGYVAEEGRVEVLTIDQYSGEVLLNSTTDFPNSGHAYLSWLKPIHYGSFGGLPTKILALLGGLVPLVLFVTGFIIWWPRFKKQRGKTFVQKKNSVDVKSSGSYWHILRKNFLVGLRYAGWFLVLSFIMGALYGLPSGIVIQPAAFSVLFTGVLVVANFAIAIVVLIVGLILLLFGKTIYALIRYFALSFAFFVVFSGVIMAIQLSRIAVF